MFRTIGSVKQDSSAFPRRTLEVAQKRQEWSAEGLGGRLAGWVNRHQLEVIQYLREENRVKGPQIQVS